MRNRLFFSIALALALHAGLWLVLKGGITENTDRAARRPVMTLSVLAQLPVQKYTAVSEIPAQPATPVKRPSLKNTPASAAANPAGESAPTETSDTSSAVMPSKAESRTDPQEPFDGAASRSGPVPAGNATGPPDSDALFAGLSEGMDLPLPPYPSAARRWGYEGTVRIRMHLRADGGISGVELVTSSGYSILDKSVLNTVKKHWRFNPPGEIRSLEKEFVFTLE